MAIHLFSRYCLSTSISQEHIIKNQEIYNKSKTMELNFIWNMMRKSDVIRFEV